MTSGTERTKQGFFSGTLLLAWLILGLLGGPLAFAAEPRAGDLPTGLRFATVWRIHGEVSAIAASGGSERKLREGDIVFVGERLRAAATAEAVLKTTDAGVIALRPGGEFVAEHFAADGKASDSVTVRLITGSLRVITGWIGRLNRAGHKVVTPTATIGIRGTDHEPYVLSGEMAAATGNKPGTYDKVNRGGTTLAVGDNKVDIAPGQVGFVRDAPTAPAAGETRAKTRLLMTILLPVLLDKVPNIYVAGRFDAELDRFAKTADKESQRELEKLNKGPAAATPPVACNATRLARTWLRQLDHAAQRRDAAAIIAKFAPDVAVRATVRGNDGKLSTLDLDRKELAESTIAAIKGLSDYKQRRISIEATPADASDCSRLKVKSVVIEQGKQSGKPYRFESLEEYELEQREGKWLAIQAETTQR
ncbi:MAG TPA: hypothetical protein VFH22_07935 [Rhodocyclaceae bacterium]|nr:hypothetical protein [Rhodocyclaceae bacterium]